MKLTVTRKLSDVRSRSYPVATIGNFDGHHCGHRALLQMVVEAARKAQGTALVLTFDPHPVKVLAPQLDFRFLTSPQEKLARFEESGIDEVVCLEFTPALAAMTPEQFTENVLSRGLNIAEIFVGQHFVFGKGRSGKIDDLMKLGEVYGFKVHPVAPVTCNGGPVSSTRIRQLIHSGKLEEASVLLGRAYSLEGIVVRGRELGQSIGWPTANIPIPPQRVIPPDGVYAVRATFDSMHFDAIAYIGRRPTFGAGERMIEVNLLDERRDLYGKVMAVEFIERLRGDRTFASAQELSAQIELDVESAKCSLRRYSQGVQRS